MVGYLARYFRRAYSTPTANINTYLRQVIDITYINTYPWEAVRCILKIKYTFRNMSYLVADKYGNFFMLEHCPQRRTIPFKQLDKSKGYIYYGGNKIRLSTLRKRAVKNIKTINL